MLYDFAEYVAHNLWWAAPAMLVGVYIAGWLAVRRAHSKFVPPKIIKPIPLTPPVTLTLAELEGQIVNVRWPING